MCMKPTVSPCCLSLYFVSVTHGITAQTVICFRIMLLESYSFQRIYQTGKKYAKMIMIYCFLMGSCSVVPFVKKNRYLSACMTCMICINGNISYHLALI